MMVRDPRVDAYIAQSAEYARPILEHLRAVVHEGCPEVEETIKWGAPSFVHAGGIVCGMAAFKQHASFGFWRHALVTGQGKRGEGMGSIGKLGTMADLPPRRRLVAWVRKAARLNEDGIKAPPARAPKPAPGVPPDLQAALDSRKHARARRTFAAFAPGHRRDYIEWITEAKRPETRARRLEQALAWMAEGKRRNWKYQAC